MDMDPRRLRVCTGGRIVPGCAGRGWAASTGHGVTELLEHGPYYVKHSQMNAHQSSIMIQLQYQDTEIVDLTLLSPAVPSCSVLVRDFSCGRLVKLVVN